MSGEIDMKEGKGPELPPCVPEDLSKVAKSNKDTLRVFAKKKFGINIDCGSHLKLIRKDLTKRVQVALGHIIDNPDTDDAIKRAIEMKIPRYVLHPVNKRVFEATPALLKRTDLIPCDKEGVPMGHFEDEEEIAGDDNGGSDELERIAQDLEDKIDNDKDN